MKVDENQKYEIVVSLESGYTILESDHKNLPGFLEIICKAMDDTIKGSAPYFCQFNLMPYEGKTLWMNFFRSDCVKGYYVRIPYHPSQRIAEVAEEQLRMMKAEHESEKWKHGDGEDGD